ncbi:hypothetical protein [Streptomyces sp. NRRL S-118]|uniref:hypothetical protein n=1 Tax=Streptomyces sp. NRRL S-118 TaxID=1463881 RepID=UPI00131DC943|nr:hypothetical protein [Streptomyces sp. NRRL S-118]
MNDAGEVKAAELGDETLARLTGALGRPPLSMLENAKALFPFASSGNGDENADPVSVPQADRVRS